MKLTFLIFVESFGPRLHKAKNVVPKTPPDKNYHYEQSKEAQKNTTLD